MLRLHADSYDKQLGDVIIQNNKYIVFLSSRISRTQYNRCGEILSTWYTLNCKKWVLFATFHNDLFDRVSNLYSKAFMTLHVRDGTLIHTDHVMWGVKTHLEGKK